MDDLGNVGTKLAQALQESRREDRQRLTRLVEVAGGAADWLRSHGLAGYPDDLEVGELTGETTAFWLDSAKRERSCQRCPDYGGACAGELSCLPPGRYLAWEDRQYEIRSCKRWPEHVVRTRLSDSGVPFRMQHYRIETFRRTPGNDQAHLEAAVMVKSCVAQSTVPNGLGWLVLSGDPNTGKSHLVVAMLRTIRRERPLFRVQYKDADLLAREIQTYLDNRETHEYPLDRLMSCDVLAIENVALPKMKQWLQREVEDLLRKRWEAGQATIVTSRDNAASLRRSLSNILTDLENGAALCTLT